MRWLKLDYIKMHSRIDYDCEDSLLELYANAAENLVLNVLRRTYEEVVNEFGSEDEPFPSDLILASLQIVENEYNHRTMITMTNLSLVPYTFDILVLPYMKLGYD